jgi:hypothetical protein
MTIAELGSVGEFAGSIVVLVTLVYLSIQLRQSNDIATARTREHVATLTIAELMQFSDSAEDWHAFLLGEELTDTQKVKLNFQLLAMMRRQEFDWWQYKHDLLDEEAFRGSQTHLYDAFRAPGMRQWWQHLGREGHFNLSFVEEIDGIAREVNGGTESPYSKANWDRWTNRDDDA